MTAGILINPASAKTGKKGHALARAASGMPGVVLRRLDDFSRLGDHIRDFAQANAEVIVISGGDGTVQAAVTALAEQSPFKTPPRLVLMPHGTTNMTAADIGFKGASANALLDAVSQPGFAARATHVKARPSVRISGLEGAGPQHGFFFGGGAVTRAVLKCQEDVHRWGLKGDWATGATLALGLIKAITGRDGGDPDRFNQPTRTDISADDQPFGAPENLLFLITSLDKLILGCRPFWNRSNGPLHLTMIGYPVSSILRNTRHVMFGGDQRPLDPATYFSTSAHSIALSGDGRLILDGEIHDQGPAGLTITPGPSFEYICGL